ncbi:MAG: phenylacetate--CoA ligase family protein [Alphaproteobacteria bacterium]|nr:phenylacetate--CoA ligase family protein [Alphaproteobacteria bacterium]
MARRKSRRPKPKRRPAAPPSAGRAAPTPESPSQALKGVRVPRSGRSGIHWPAIPNYAGAVVLALQYQWEQTQWWPHETLLKHQFRQIELLLAHAARTVPFYRERLKILTGTKRGDLTLDLFRRIPLLTRTDIQEAGDALITRRLPKGHGKPFDLSTSGSTGSPITVKGTGITGLFLNALNLRYHIWHDRDFSGKTAAITRLTSSKAPKKPTAWVAGYASGPMVTFDVTRPVTEQLAWLKEVNPDYLLTYPSNLLCLVQRCGETGDRVPRLREVATMGEILEPAVRAACERVWRVRVVDAYSAQEVGIIATQCPENPHYHVQSESVLVEVLDGDGEPCAPGQIGRLVITDMHNFATPLIRYEIGDYAEPGGPCSCGRTLPVLTRILGRTRNMLTLPSGDRMWPVYSEALCEALPQLRQAQLVQRTLDEIEVRLVVASRLTPQEEDRARAALGKALSDAFAYRFVYVDEIPRSPAGKFEEVKSELDGLDPVG